jgi:Flp pilus assembly protein TadB
VTATLLAIFSTLALLGIVVIATGLAPVNVNQAARMPSRLQLRLQTYRSNFGRRRQLLALVGLLAGVVLWLVTGWFVLLIAAPAAAIGVPVLLGRGNEAEVLARLEALETWTRSLAGLTVTGYSLEQTVAASLNSTPDAIRPYVGTLVARLNARWVTKDALQMFADELSDPTGDLIVAHLLLAEKVRGAGLANALDDLAEIILEDVKVRRQIETDRSKPRSSVRIITITTLALLALIPFIGQFMEPYRTVPGQVALSVWLIVYVVLLVWLKRITIGKQPPRILDNPRERSA